MATIGGCFGPAGAPWPPSAGKPAVKATLPAPADAMAAAAPVAPPDPLGFVLTLALSLKAPLLWDGCLAERTLFDLSGLGTHAGGAVAFAAWQLGLYLWHRTLHRSEFLFRWFHRMHHSAERTGVWGAYLFHPLDTLAFAFVFSLVLVGGLGVSAPAAMAAGVLSTFCAIFQHANLRTPRWLGFVLQRPESHALHHQRGVHAWNYADLPLWDMLFGTFRNPEGVGGPAGFWDGASAQVGALLAGRDVTQPPPPEAARPGVGDVARAA